MAHEQTPLLPVVGLVMACTLGLSAALVQLANSGPPPDVVGVWVDDSDVGAIAMDGSFIYQSATIGQAPYIGRYLSYQCNPDGSWSTVYVQHFFDANGNVNGTSPGCGTGYFVDGLFTSIFALTDGEVCPLGPNAETETIYHTMVPGSTLGALLNATFCSSLRRGVLEHPILPSV
ncbi:hypothetical protein WJX77_007668 [Trebouxia sp. C0004]